MKVVEGKELETASTSYTHTHTHTPSMAGSPTDSEMGAPKRTQIDTIIDKETFRTPRKDSTTEPGYTFGAQSEKNIKK